MGPEAKYFSSLTKEEQDRVNKVLLLLDQISEESVDPAKQLLTTNENDPKMSSEKVLENQDFFNGYCPSQDQLQRITEIDQ